MLHILFALSLAIVALLYSSVGQAGGTGYVALMGLAGFMPAVIKPSALALNILVSAIGCIRFYRADLVTWRTCYPFAILGLPFSLIGGALHLPAGVYHPVVGILLLIAGVQMLRPASGRDGEAHPKGPPFMPSLVAGGVLGIMSGVTGVGGGIFLAPLVLALGWAGARQVAAISAVFNLLNSGAALAGAWVTMPDLPAELPLWLLCVGAGGYVGSWLGAFYFKPETLRKILAFLLMAGAMRLIGSIVV